MRILAICAAGMVSGREIVTLHLLRAMKERGHECFCIVSSWGSDDFRHRLRTLEVPFINMRIGFISKRLTVPAVLMTTLQAYYWPGLLVRYLAYKKRSKPDVIIHTNFHHSFLLYPLMNRGKDIYWSHEILPINKFYTNLFKRLSTRIYSFVAVSDAVAIPLRQFAGEACVRVIKNGVIIPGAPLAAHKPSKVFTIAIIGQVSAHKGHDILVRALRHISQDRYVLRIFGSGSDVFKVQLQRLMDEMGIAENCIWEGYVKDIDELYKGVDLVVVPSISADPYPTTVMEASIRAIPVVGSDSGGLPELIQNDVNGYVFKSGDSEALKEAIEKVIYHPDLAGLRDRTVGFARNRFSVAKFADAFEKLFFEMSKK
jgi:glycosyltransferase involved in cell wall biosynthesis